MKSAVCAVMLIVLATGLSQAQSFGARLDEYFRLEWEVEQERDAPEITGYI